MEKNISVAVLLLVFDGLGAMSCAISASDTNYYADTADRGAYEADADTDADSDADADTGDDWAPEDEDDFLLLEPAVTDAYVFVANPERNTVTRIEVPSLEVITVGVGENPTSMQTTIDYTKAVTFNAGSNTLSVIDAETLDVTDVGVRPNLNTLALSPDGVWAVAYHDADVDPADEPSSDPGGVESFNEISIVDTDTYESYDMVVGLNPKDVVFTPDGKLALVVSDESVTQLDLTGSEPASTMIYVTDDLLDPPVAEEVALTPDGTYAFVRQFGADAIVVVDLVAGTTGSVPVGFNPTDLDLTPDGSHAVVVSRGAKQLWIFDTSDPFATPSVLDWTTQVNPDTVLGSLLLTPDGSTGILYTNATLQDSYVTWDVGSGTFVQRPLVKPVQSIGIAPTGSSMLVFHTYDDVEGADTDDPYYHHWAITLVSLSDFRQNPLKLAAEPTAYAHSSDGLFGFFIMDGEKYLEALDYTSLLAEDVSLKSLPEFVGALPDSPYAYVSQQHNLGRISFYDTTDSSLQTITGFELNSEIEH
jgi:DNA-binding beta-propeller fold protein YncE